MKRILINATHNEEIRVALCKGNHLYDFDLENRTREQKKSNIYKGHVTRVEPSLEAVFVEYGSQRQGFLPIREIANEYLKGNARDENIRKLIKEGDELIVQVEKEERGNKGAALSTYVSLAGRYLVLMPNNPRGGGISRQISGKLREDMKRMLGNLDLPKGMSVIIRTAGIGKTQEDLQHDLNHLLNIWQTIQEQNKKYPSPRLVHQEAGVVTRAVRDYLRDDITEIWIDNENAYIEAAGFIDAVMPKQADKLRKYTDFEPMFARFGIEKQIETAYQREVRLPSGGSIVIDQTEALVSIDINSAKSTKGADVAETAYHTNLEAADEIARQLRLRDMGGLIVIDFIDMNDNKHQKEVEKRLVEATKYDRARVQFGDISRFGLMEMSRQRLRPSLEESTGYICPRCHGNGMIRDLRSLSLSIMRQIEQIALKERQGEVQAEVPTDIAAFLLNEKRDSLVYLEQDSGTRITILPHAHLESPNFKLHFNRDGFAPSSYERITDTQQQETNELGYDVDWQTADKERPEQQPTRQPRVAAIGNNAPTPKPASQVAATPASPVKVATPEAKPSVSPEVNTVAPAAAHTAKPQAVAWLSNLFAPTPQATTADSISSQAAAEAIEAIVNTGAQSLGAFGQVDSEALAAQSASNKRRAQDDTSISSPQAAHSQEDEEDQDEQEKRRRRSRKGKSSKPRHRKDKRDEPSKSVDKDDNAQAESESDTKDKPTQNRRPANSRRDSRGQMPRTETLTPDNAEDDSKSSQDAGKDRDKSHQRDRSSNSRRSDNGRRRDNTSRSPNPNEVSLQVNEAPTYHKEQEVVHLSLDDSKAAQSSNQHQKGAGDNKADSPKSDIPKADTLKTDDKSSTPSGVAPAAQVEESNRSDNTQADKSLPVSVAKEATTDKTTTDKTTTDETTTDETTTDQAATDQAATDEAATDDSSSDATQTKTAPTASSEASDSETPVVKKVEATPAESSENLTAADDNGAKHSSDDANPGKDAAKSNDKMDNDKVDNDTSVVSNHSTNESEASTDKPGSDNVDTDRVDATIETALTPGYDVDSLFTDRYVTAKKYGLASNDPRAVKAKLADQPQKSDDKAASITSMAKIRGTVGEFIHATLPDAKSRLEDNGVISSFIQAVQAFNQEAQKSGNSESGAQAGSNSHFDFSNYGYAPLDATYLGRFNRMTQAVRQIATEQGKTPVSPLPITRRASNDPRGQHPDYKAPSPVKSAATKVAATALTAELNSADVAKESAALLLEDAEVTQHLAAARAKLADNNDDLANADSAKADLDAESTEVSTEEKADTLVAADKAVKVADHAQTIVEESQDREPESETSTSQSEETHSSETQQTSEEEPTGSSKTTIASYKNMIENVAEQLLPQQSSLFNLTTPKVPKSRSRKSKTEHKKPTQSDQQSESASDNDSASSDTEK